MARFFRNSQVWAIEYLYDGRTRHWLKAFPQGTDAELEVRAMLEDLYGRRARLVEVRPATEQEDDDFRHGRLPRNVFCPTGRAP